MKIQEMRERITLLQRHYEEDDKGYFQEEWSEVGKVWARIILLSPSLYDATEGWGRKNPVTPLFKIQIRYPAPKFQRIKWRSKIFCLMAPPQRSEDYKEMKMWIYEKE